MKIIDVNLDEDFITLHQAKQKIESRINNNVRDRLYVLKYDGKIISISGEYYKFAWKSIRDVKNALTLKFGKELSEALVENDVIEVYEILI